VAKSTAALYKAFIDSVASGLKTVYVLFFRHLSSVIVLQVCQCSRLTNVETEATQIFISILLGFTALTSRCCIAPVHTSPLRVISCHRG